MARSKVNEKYVPEHTITWQMDPNGAFRPGTTPVEGLPPGVYSYGFDFRGMHLDPMPKISDDIIPLPNCPSEAVVHGIQKFWDSRDRYVTHGLVYRRGYLMHGPPGSGKTVTIRRLSEQVQSMGGFVIYGSGPESCATVLKTIRGIEPDRPLVVIYEDIDQWIDGGDETELLALLDGENQIDNVVFVATTNYIEDLPPRVVNRPSRFDELVYVGMPDPDSRLVYLTSLAKRYGINPKVTLPWVSDTDGFSIAHLRELAVAVWCLDQEYPEVLKRLKSMFEKPTKKD